MQKLRKKQIDTFIDTLNEREQRYIIEKVKNIIVEKDANRLNFTINNKNRIIA